MRWVTVDAEQPLPDTPRSVWQLFTWVPARVNESFFWGRVVAGCILLAWSAVLFSTSWQRADIGESFLHRVNLVFHEAGHLVFAPFGTFMMYLGGSLMQCLVPLVCAGTFLWQRNPFGAAACTWWLGQNFVDLAAYIGDAFLMSLPLLGEWSDDAIAMRAERHDWHNILGTLGLLRQDHVVAQLAAVCGWLLMAIALAWGAWLLVRQFPRRAMVLDE